jgi:hypothetical protein
MGHPLSKLGRIQYDCRMVRASNNSMQRRALRSAADAER